MSTLTAQPNSDPEYLRAQGLSANIVDRFYDKILFLVHRPECWLWRAYVWHGYGTLNTGIFPYRIKPAHVVSYIIHRGPVPVNMLVRHRCPGGPRRDCVNPAHLELGSKVDNARDALSDGRQAFCKLNYQKAGEIRNRWTGYRGQQTELAKEYGVSRHAISLIVLNKTWWRADAPVFQPIDKPRAELNWNQVREIRRKRKAGASLNELAAEYHVSFSQISKIYCGTCWIE